MVEKVEVKFLLGMDGMDETKCESPFLYTFLSTVYPILHMRGSGPSSSAPSIYSKQKGRNLPRSVFPPTSVSSKRTVGPLSFSLSWLRVYPVRFFYRNRATHSGEASMKVSGTV